MFETTYSASKRSTYGYSPANWEEDIRDVVLETCDKEEDPSGYRVVFYKINTKVERDEDPDTYRMGASYLRTRLKKLSRAGFDAPMTKKAIQLIDKKRFVRVA